MNDLGIYLQGTDDPVPVGYVVDTEERVVRNGNSVLHRTFKPAPPPALPVPQDFPDGITSTRIETTEPAAGVVLVDPTGAKYTFTPVDGLPVMQPITGSPEHGKAEIEGKLAALKQRLNETKIKDGMAKTKKANREDDEKLGKVPKTEDVLAELLARLEVVEETVTALRGEPLM